jgi:phosphoribosylformimino-5-aminoimidazole carboxamide ribotide isomerase
MDPRPAREGNPLKQGKTVRRTACRASPVTRHSPLDTRHASLYSLSVITIIPAIDLKNGRCVRLLQGRADAETVYSEDPVSMAKHWQDEGAEYLHVVDLDGAFNGNPVHTELVAAIAAAINVPVEVGGGLRTEEQVRRLLDSGVRRAIIGTRACGEPAALAELVKQFGPGLAVGIDARDGFVQMKGWTQSSAVRAEDLAKQADEAGVRTLIVTDTATDGMLTGVNAKAIDKICALVSCDVVASGGISSAKDIEALLALNRPNLKAAIVGKALYEKRVSLPELITAGRSPAP